MGPKDSKESSVQPNFTVSIFTSDSGIQGDLRWCLQVMRSPRNWLKGSIRANTSGESYLESSTRVLLGFCNPRQICRQCLYFTKLPTHTCLPTATATLSLPSCASLGWEAAWHKQWLYNSLRLLFWISSVFFRVLRQSFLNPRQKKLRKPFEHWDRSNQRPCTCTSSPSTPISPSGRPQLWSVIICKGGRRMFFLLFDLHDQSFPTICTHISTPNAMDISAVQEHPLISDKMKRMLAGIFFCCAKNSPQGMDRLFVKPYYGSHRALQCGKSASPSSSLQRKREQV